MESVMELAATQNPPRDTDALRAALRSLQADGITFAEISKSTEVHRTAISQLVNQGILPSPKHVASLWVFVDRQREAQAEPCLETPDAYKQSLEIWETEEYVLAKGWCDYIYQKRKMGVLIGAPGTGKTTILKNFVSEHPGSIYIEAMPNMRVNDLLNAIAHRAGISPKGNGCQRMEGLIEALSGRTDVAILVDEAEYLKNGTLTSLNISGRYGTTPGRRSSWQARRSWRPRSKRHREGQSRTAVSPEI